MSQLNELRKDFEVKDLLQATTKIVFVLESPHRKELENGCPVAGLSGKTMTKKLVEGNDKPFGILLKEHIASEEKVSHLSVFGIMNICPIPMQKIAFPQSVQKDYQEYLEIVEKIRKSSKKKKNSSADFDQVFVEIIRDFQKRMVSLDVENVLFIPCGNFARFMFGEAVKGMEDIRYLDDIPHPSYNSWGQKRYIEQIDRLLASIESAKERNAVLVN